jgi:hypothetical protein
MRNGLPPAERGPWEEVSLTMEIRSGEVGTVVVYWTQPSPGEVIIKRNLFSLYTRGDLPKKQKVNDPVARNEEIADEVITKIGSILNLSFPRQVGSGLNAEQTRSAK